jgi:VanZ family protein
VTLALGLWPFHAPKNQVSWVKPAGLYLGDYGTAVSSNQFPAARDGNGCSLEIWLEPRRIDDSNTLLAFYNPENPRRLDLREYGHSLVLTINDENLETSIWFFVRNVFSKNRPTFLTITASMTGTAVYVDGLLAASSSKVLISQKEFSGTLVVANSPIRNDSWSGLLRGLAIYNSELKPVEVRRHHRSWTQSGQPKITPTEKSVALYLFNENRGYIAHSVVKPEIDLSIPQHYLVLHQAFLEPPWKEFRRTFNYFLRSAKNVIGFVPLGFFSFAYFVARQNKRASLMAILLGAAVSLTIESLQACLPTRDSGMTDLFTNTVGTALGVILHRLRWARRFLISLLDLLANRRAKEWI